MTTRLVFPEKVLKVLEKLNNNGFEAYVVGGAVRDAVSGKASSDFDITTNAKTDDVKRIFEDSKVIETGVKHGTVTICFDGDFFEITTFRLDGEYLDARHPDSVDFVGELDKDLIRRDFTINAMAYSQKSGVIDLFGGKNDLDNKLIRAVGDPDKRFCEDALRILRAVRFSSKLGFTIEENTLAAMRNNISGLKTLSAERIFSELTKILCGEYRYFALHNYSDIIFAVIPELAAEYQFDQINRSHKYDVYEHTLAVIDLCEDLSPTILWAALLHDSGKPYTVVMGADEQRHFPNHWGVSDEIAERVLSRLKAPKEIIKEVRFLVYYHDDYFHGGKPTIKRFLNKYGEKYMLDLCVIKKADLYAHSEFGVERYFKLFNEFENNLNEALISGECYSLSMLAINGEVVKNLGYSGKTVGDILEDVLNEVIDENLQNDKDSIIGYIKRKW